MQVIRGTPERLESAGTRLHNQRDMKDAQVVRQDALSDKAASEDTTMFQENVGRSILQREFVESMDEEGRRRESRQGQQRQQEGQMHRHNSQMVTT